MVTAQAMIGPTLRAQLALALRSARYGNTGPSGDPPRCGLFAPRFYPRVRGFLTVNVRLLSVVIGGSTKANFAATRGARETTAHNW
jgi:hypothetical protein